MDREIKFRIYDFNLKKFHYVYFIDCLPVTEYADHCHSGELSEPQECIGIEDKNKKELYEGDFIKHWDEVGYIENILDAGHYIHECTLLEGNFEIIGNKYENPELEKEIGNAIK